MARVLIVDDDADASEALVRVLRHRGHEATWVGNGRTAMALLIADTPDFAVFDFKMPGMTGLELLKAARSYLRPEPPAVIVTAYPGSTGAARRRQARCHRRAREGQPRPPADRRPGRPHAGPGKPPDAADRPH